MANDEESITALAQRYRRNTRDLGIIRLCDAVLRQQAAQVPSIAIAPTKPVKALPDSQKRNDYMRDYMRRKRAAASQA